MKSTNFVQILKQNFDTSKLNNSDANVVNFLIDYHNESLSPIQFFQDKTCIEKESNFLAQIYNYHARPSSCHPDKGSSLSELKKVLNLEQYAFEKNMFICFESMLVPNKDCSYLEAEKFKQLGLITSMKDFLFSLEKIINNGLSV